MARMTEQQMGAVLARAAAFDGRRPDPIVLAAWMEAIGDLGYDDAMRAVVDHYAESTEWLKPAHLRARVKRMRADRLANADLALPPADPDAADYGPRLREHLRALADGRSLPRALTAGDRTPAPPTKDYTAARAAHAAPAPPGPVVEPAPLASATPWCGRCNDTTRTRTRLTSEGGLERVPCPVCGPATSGSAA
ncbi:hypothetical protein J0910_00485 [Nocardiopsis sp. CNT-189]|uniref:hypothetical protein n=1 Tax=Nocardiopsis oceanisediminis TaxID=2816862 RepID=UPI003B318B42